MTALSDLTAAALKPYSCKLRRISTGRHGGGRFGQSLTAIYKLAPDSSIGEGLSVHYSGDETLDDDINDWLGKNSVSKY